MQLRKTEAFGLFDHHQRGVGHIDPDFDHRGRDQQFCVSARETLHRRIFEFARKLPMDHHDIVAEALVQYRVARFDSAETVRRRCPTARLVYIETLEEGKAPHAPGATPVRTQRDGRMSKLCLQRYRRAADDIFGAVARWVVRAGTAAGCSGRSCGLPQVCYVR